MKFMKIYFSEFVTRNVNNKKMISELGLMLFDQVEIHGLFTCRFFIFQFLY